MGLAPDGIRYKMSTPVLTRDLKQLANETFDLLVIGAGIHGACAAYEAARRGIKTALVEKSDYCSGNSANSLKIVHGGLRYLQNFDFKRMRDSIRERNYYQRLAPHLVSPLSCILPTFGMTTKSKHALRVALLLNDFISFDRNKGIKQDGKRLPAGKTLSKDDLKNCLPYVSHDDYTGAAMWFDAQLQNTERFVLGFIKAAVREGAETANYCKAEKIITRDGKVAAVEMQDTIDGSTFEIRTNSILNCAGPGINDLLGSDTQPFKPSIAINLIFDQELPGGCAAGLRHVFKHNDRDWSRIFFYTPWRGKTVIGTRHTPVEKDIQLRGITEEQIDRYLEELQETTPALKLDRDKLSFWHWGVIPMEGINTRNGEVQLQRHALVVDHKKDGFEGLTSAIGVKYTTGRSVAERALRTHCARNQISCRQGSLPVEPLPGADLELASESIAKTRDEYSLTDRQVERLLANLGDEVTELEAVFRDSKESTIEIPDSEGITAAQVLHAVRNESALHLTDVVLRRTDLGSHQRPGSEAIAAVADIMAKELSWDRERRQSEIVALEKVYLPVA
jgi:glycerol-3-phosphate dehydrogenase